LGSFAYREAILSSGEAIPQLSGKAGKILSLLSRPLSEHPGPERIFPEMRPRDSGNINKDENPWVRGSPPSP
jgi:hypothetical protein